jgi:hypothetical protein
MPRREIPALKVLLKAAAVTACLNFVVPDTIINFKLLDILSR